MTSRELERIKEWFSSFVSGFVSDDPDLSFNFRLKKDHTYRVLENTVRICGLESVCEKDSLSAQASAMLHDIGRFPQYAKYRTFRDNLSVNHGRLGAEIISRKGILDGPVPDEKALILNCVRYHSCYLMPRALSGKARFFLGLLRDADKLDIFRVMLESYEAEKGEKALSAGLNLPVKPECTPEVVREFLAGRAVTLKMLKTVNDFRITQISWIYDMNLNASLKLLQESGHIEMLISRLPDGNHKEAVWDKAYEYISARLSASS